jgi:hypothetical protein
MENAPLGETLAMLLVGQEQSGKSRLAATAPGPVLFIDCDRKAGSLRGLKDVYTFTPKEPTNPNHQPTGFNQIIELLSMLEKSLALSQLGVTSDKDIATIVFDSIATLADMARAYILYTAEKELAFSVTIGGRKYRVPKSWTAWGAEKEMVTQAIMAARAIPKLNVVCTLHEVAEEAEDSTEDNPHYTGRMSVYPVRYNALLKYFDEIWRLQRVQKGAPTIQIAPNGNFTKAGSVLGIDSITTPDISYIIQQARLRQKNSSVAK